MYFHRCQRRCNAGTCQAAPVSYSQIGPGNDVEPILCDSLPIGKDIMDGKELMLTSTLTSKGQITIPKELRDQLHLKKGSRLEFVVEASGRVILQPLNSDFRSLRGMIRSKRRRPVSIEEMNKAIAGGYSGT